MVSSKLLPGWLYSARIYRLAHYLNNFSGNWIRIGVVALGKWPIRPVCSAVDGERRGLYQFLLQFQKFYTNVMRWSAEYRTLYKKLFQAVIEMLVESKLVEEIESGHGRSFICLAPKYMETRTQRSIAGKRELMNCHTRN